jgi:hypothetical protein
MIERDAAQAKPMAAARQEIAQRIVDADLRGVQEPVAVLSRMHAAQDQARVADVDVARGDVPVNREPEHARKDPSSQRAAANREHTHGHQSNRRHGPCRSPAHQELSTHRWHRGLPPGPDAKRTLKI